MTDNIFEIKVTRRNFTKIELRAVVTAARDVLKTEMYNVERTAKKNYLSGPRPDKLGVVTNNLRSAVKGSVEQSGYNLLGHVGFGKHAWYGRLHEEGIGGQKKRSFMVPSIEDHIKDIEAKILASIDETLAGQI